ncbi:MAG: L-threonylcarbamoyladenylate synthase [Trueperella sp.]|nr:L-threonylcarbamoyladenylate synthase [Trueperella sp.]
MIGPITDPDIRAAARAALARDEVICLPTDTVYGVGVDPYRAPAVQNLLRVKRRTIAKPPPILVGKIDDARALCPQLSPAALDLIQEFWPGALTIVLPTDVKLGWDLSEMGGTIALRMPNSPATLELLAETGPLAVTSANLTEHDPATSAQAAQAQLGDAVSVYLDAGESGGGVPSTIVRLTADGAAVQILRHGAISAAQIAALVKVQP